MAIPGTLLLLVFLLQWKVLFESARFLAVARGKFYEARKILEKIAKFNGKPIFCETLEGEKVIGYTESNSLNSSQNLQENSERGKTEFTKIRVYNFQSGPKYFSTVMTPTGSVAVTEIESKELQVNRRICDLCNFESTKKVTGTIFTLFICTFFNIEGVQLNLISAFEDQRKFFIILGGNFFISSCLTFLTIQKLGKHGSLGIGLGISCICCVAYAVIQIPNSAPNGMEFFTKLILLNISLICLNSARFTILFQAAENICTVLRITLIGLIFSFGILFILLSRYMHKALDFLDQPSIIYYSLIIGISCLFSCTLSDNTDKIIKDFLEEQKQDLLKEQDLSIILPDQQEDKSKLNGVKHISTIQQGTDDPSSENEEVDASAAEMMHMLEANKFIMTDREKLPLEFKEEVKENEEQKVRKYKNKKFNALNEEKSI